MFKSKKYRVWHMLINKAIKEHGRSFRSFGWMYLSECIDYRVPKPPMEEYLDLFTKIVTKYAKKHNLSFEELERLL